MAADLARHRRWRLAGGHCRGPAEIFRCGLGGAALYAAACQRGGVASGLLLRRVLYAPRWRSVVRCSLVSDLVIALRLFQPRCLPRFLRAIRRLGGCCMVPGQALIVAQRALYQ